MEEQLALQKKELFFWFHAEMKSKENALSNQKKMLDLMKENELSLESKVKSLQEQLEFDQKKIQENKNLEEKIKELNQIIEETNKKNKEDFSILESKHKAAIKEITNSSNASLELFRSKHAEEISGISEVHARQLAELKETHAKTLEQLHSDAQRFDESRQAAFQNRYSQLSLEYQNELESLAAKISQKTQESLRFRKITDNTLHALLKESEIVRQVFAADDNVIQSALLHSSASISHLQLVTNSAINSEVKTENEYLDPLALLNPALSSASRSAVYSAASKVREFHLQSQKAISETDSLKLEISELTDHIVQLKKEIEKFKIEVDNEKEIQSGHIRKLLKDHNENLETLSRQHSTELKMIRLELEHSNQLLEEAERNCTSKQKTIYQLESECNSLKYAHSTSSYHSDHYSTLAGDLAQQLKSKEEQVWKAMIDMEKMKSDLQYMKTISTEAKREIDLKEHLIVKTRESKEKESLDSRAKLSELQQSLFGAINELQTKSKLCNDLQRKVDQLTDIVEESLRSSSYQNSQPPNHAPTIFSNGLNYNPLVAPPRPLDKVSSVPIIPSNSHVPKVSAPSKINSKPQNDVKRKSGIPLPKINSNVKNLISDRKDT